MQTSVCSRGIPDLVLDLTSYLAFRDVSSSVDCSMTTMFYDDLRIRLDSDKLKTKQKITATKTK